MVIWRMWDQDFNLESAIFVFILVLQLYVFLPAKGIFTINV